MKQHKLAQTEYAKEETRIARNVFTIVGICTEKEHRGPKSVGVLLMMQPNPSMSRQVQINVSAV